MDSNRKTARGTIPKRGMNGLRDEAVARGEKFYSTGMPCIRGHIALRRTCNHMCVVCEKIVHDNYKKTDKYQKRRRATYEKTYVNDPIRFIYDRARGRAKRKNLPFDISPEYVRSLWPLDNMCPAIGIPLKPNVGGNYQNHNSPALDRFKPELGYIEGNVYIISTLANQMKADCAAPELLRKLADWMESINDAMGNVEAFEKIMKMIKEK